MFAFFCPSDSAYINIAVGLWIKIRNLKKMFPNRFFPLGPIGIRFSSRLDLDPGFFLGSNLDPGNLYQDPHPTSLNNCLKSRNLVVKIYVFHSQQNKD